MYPHGLLFAACTLNSEISQFTYVFFHFFPCKYQLQIGHSDIAWRTGDSFSVELIDNLTHHVKDYVESYHLTKFDVFRVGYKSIQTYLMLRQRPPNHINS